MGPRPHQWKMRGACGKFYEEISRPATARGLSHAHSTAGLVKGSFFLHMLHPVMRAGRRDKREGQQPTALEKLGTGRTMFLCGLLRTRFRQL